MMPPMQTYTSDWNFWLLRNRLYGTFYFYDYLYIFFMVDYVSNDHEMVLKFLEENIFIRFSMPKPKISNNGTQFCNKTFWP